ncbi:hypothetical protein BJ875DRAFT_283544 [Amylocarpus encephaloides]|uniref:Chorismate synthase protein n=1 Tax=Amylocarpus encephaloides TaxID=45428 RepID=A0A9P7YKA7_9HELO|nr:hypothetical protein BJ875DRAFT_283544 [Amylocarpus encephaloides]
MAISWGTIKSLLLFFGPLLLPKALAYYRSVRAGPSIHGVPIRPIPSAVSRALLILFVAASIFLIRTLPPFSPENIFSLTASRLQIPTDVLFTRLSTLRGTGLTDNDNILRTKISSLESRLLFLQFGPDVVTNCQFCTPEDPKSYLYYFLPALLAPHLINLIVIAAVTSGLFTGKEGGVWRTTATIAAGAAAFLDIWLTSTYDARVNARATRLEELNSFFWKMRIYRFIGLSLLDGLLGWLLYLSSTNRAFITAPSPAERIEISMRLLDVVRSKMSAMSIMRNTVSRDESLRERSNQYWVHEGRVMGELMEQRDVMESVNNALENRINMQNISKDAESYANNVVAPLEVIFQGGQPSEGVVPVA